MLREGTAKCLDRLRKEESKKINPIAKTTPWSCCTQVSSRQYDRGGGNPILHTWNVRGALQYGRSPFVAFVAAAERGTIQCNRL